MVGLKEHLSDHTYPTKLRDYYRFLHNIASTILFHDDSLYEEANLEINTEFILKNVKAPRVPSYILRDCSLAS